MRNVDAQFFLLCSVHAAVGNLTIRARIRQCLIWIPYNPDENRYTVPLTLYSTAPFRCVLSRLR